MPWADWVTQRGIFLLHHAAGFQPAWPWDAPKTPTEADEAQRRAGDEYLLTHSALR